MEFQQKKVFQLCDDLCTWGEMKNGWNILIIEHHRDNTVYDRQMIETREWGVEEKGLQILMDLKLVFENLLIFPLTSMAGSTFFIQKFTFKVFFSAPDHFQWMMQRNWNWMSELKTAIVTNEISFNHSFDRSWCERFEEEKKPSGKYRDFKVQ